MKKVYHYFVSVNIVVGKNSFFQEVIYRSDKKITSVDSFNEVTEKLKGHIKKKLQGARIVILNYQLISTEVVQVGVNDSETFGVF